jgi:hypothetical protein
VRRGDVPGDRPLAGPLAGHALTATGDPSQRLDVDVDELTRVAALIAIGRPKRRQPAQPAEPQALADGQDDGQRHAQAVDDLGAGHPPPAQRLDHLDAAGRHAVRDRPTGFEHLSASNETRMNNMARNYN